MNGDLVLIIACGLICLMFVYLLVGIFKDRVRIAKMKGVAKARIMRVDTVERPAFSGRHIAKEPVLFYTIKEDSYQVRWSKGGGADKYQVGNVITIRYDENNPRDIFVPGDWGQWDSLVMYILTLIAVAYGLAVFAGEYFWGVNLRFWQ